MASCECLFLSSPSNVSHALTDVVHLGTSPPSSHPSQLSWHMPNKPPSVNHAEALPSDMSPAIQDVNAIRNFCSYVEHTVIHPSHAETPSHLP